MYKKSNIESDLDIFGNLTSFLSGPRLKKYESPEEWHNLFRKQITAEIDESIFACLFDKDNGRPNAPIRQIISMMILKEGHGWSDRELFENINFNLLVRSSIGLYNLNDTAPCEATYYNLRRAIYIYQIEKGIDLIGELFSKLTKKEAISFDVNGKNLRMDSTLMGSNIAKNSRLQLILNVISVFYNDIKNQDSLLLKLTSEDIKLLDSLIKQKSGQLVYRLNSQEREDLLIQLGYLLIKLQSTYCEIDSEYYRLIVRVLQDQYQIETDKIELKSGKDISSGSLQSPFDEDAEYRNKNGEVVQGFSYNGTETCNEKGLNLILNVEVQPATKSDDSFLEGGVNKSEEIVGNIGSLNVDGAYNSQDNQAFAKEKEIEVIYSGLQGKKGLYQFEIQEDGTVKVINTETGNEYKAVEYKAGKYRINDQGKTKYFTDKSIGSTLHREKIENTDRKEKNRRNNVEATMFQLKYYTRNGKTKYRGQIKNQGSVLN